MKNLKNIYKLPETYINMDFVCLPEGYNGWIQEVDEADEHIYKIYVHYVDGVRESVDNDSPSYIEMLAGQPDVIFSVEWHQNNMNHRLSGPAVMYHTDDVEYYIEGQIMSEEEYYNHPAIIKYKLNSIVKV